ncbi:MAG: phospholipase D-like domain-containing protein [Elainellaceae cyanobacterium]
MPLPFSRRWHWGAFGIATFLLLLGVGLWRRNLAQDLSPSIPLAPPLPQDPFIQVYFNQSASALYTDPYRQQERLGDDLEAVIVEAIATAQSSIDVAVQELQLPRVAQALRDKQASGVRVRVILENQYSTPPSQLTPQQISKLDERDRADYQEFLYFADMDGDRHVTAAEIDERDALAMLKAARIPIIDDTADGSKGSDLMHHKFVVIDQSRVIVGSANFTLSGTHGDFTSLTSLGNANHMLSIESGELAQIFSREFERMWGDGPGGADDSLFGLQKPYRSAETVAIAPSSSITVQFSPSSASRYSWEDSTNGLIGRTLDRAESSIDLALFVFSDQPLSDKLERRHQSDVSIRALIDAGFAYRDYSEALDMLGIGLVSDRCVYEDGNHPWMRPLETVGVPQLADGDVLHHKFGVIDQRVVITGSQNWSNAANHSNDENLLVIENPTVAAHFQREFDRLYSTASLGIPPWLNDKVGDRQQQCGL